MQLSVHVGQRRCALASRKVGKSNARVIEHEGRDFTLPSFVLPASGKEIGSMTVEELIEQLRKMPQDAEVVGVYVGGDWNHEFAVDDVNLRTQEWSLGGASYLAITPKVVIS